MKSLTKNLLVKKALASTLLSTAVALPASAALNGADNFKIAIIKDAVGSELINSGLYIDAIEAISKEDKNDVAPTNFEQAMGLCVANLKVSRYDAAETACTTAITRLEEASGSKSSYLKALAYSNRAVVRHLSNNPYGAVNDLSKALKASPNKLVYANLAKFETIK